MVPPPRARGQKRPNLALRALWPLLGFGLLLELLLLSLYPLLANATMRNAAVKQALVGLFPWLPQLYWTTRLPLVVQGLHSIPFLRIDGDANSVAAGNANLLLLLLGLAFVLVLVAARVVGRVGKERLTAAGLRLIFWTIFGVAVIFGVTAVFAPGGIAPDVFLYGLFGRMVTVYHANPYVISLSTFPPDPLYRALAKGTQGTVPGPVWLAITIPMALVARESVANVVIGFRLLGLIVYLANVVLLWVVLGKLKPQVRIAGLLLYAWNPVVLLLSVCEVRYDGVVVLCVLLAAFFFQRNSPIIGWVLVLVAGLIDLLCLLLLPLFFCLLWREARAMGRGRRFLWWLLVLAISVAVVVLAYAPWGIASVGASLRSTFLPDNAINSFDAMFLHTSVSLPTVVAWLLVAHHWMIFAALTVGFLLLLGVWLVDSLELVLLFSAWIFLALLVLLPAYWPWYTVLPLALAVSTTSRRTVQLALLLMAGGVLSYYFWLWPSVWTGQALVTIGVPLLAWGWTQFFTSTWQMTRREGEGEDAGKPARGKGASRPSWPSRPPWSSRRP